MKRLLIPLLATLTLPNSVNSEFFCGVNKVDCPKQLFAMQMILIAHYSYLKKDRYQMHLIILIILLIKTTYQKRHTY